MSKKKDEYRILYRDREKGFTLCLSLLPAGDMGPSSETENPNRLRFFRNMGLDPRQIFSLKQIHSRQLLATEEIGAMLQRGQEPRGDGLFTSRREDVLAVIVADCMPILYYHRERGCFALLHSGWKGTGILEEAQRILSERCSITPGEGLVVRGPSIGPCCYRVDRQRADLFRELWGQQAVSFRRNSQAGGDYYLDLAAANGSIMEKFGNQEPVAAWECTCCSGGYGSYRRQGPEEFSRMIALAGYFDPPGGHG